MEPSLVRWLLFLGVAGHASIAMAQSAETFTPIGNLTTPRAGHTATLLPNGKVLITGGGAGAYMWWASAELYDPSTGTFTATGGMTTPRVGHRATLLPSGKVLISGGVSSGPSAFASAELYDPSTGTFSATGDMTTPRVGHIATLLNNGKVLIASGVSSNGFVASAELYDPSTGTFTPTGDLTEPGAETATLLANGKVLITRSFDVGPNHAELYDPSTGLFTRTVDLLSDAAGPAAVLLTNGKVLIAGGYTDPQDDLPDSRAELYDPVAGVFTPTGYMTDGLESGAATLLSEGSVFIAGAADWHAGATSSCCRGITELYGPVTGTFSSPGDTPPSLGQAATLLLNGTVLISGGYAGGATLALAEIYYPAVVAPAPVLFSLSGDGRGPGAILHAATQQLVSANNPAVAGEALEIYGAGLIDGSVIPPQVAIGGRMAEVLFFGNAPGFAGLNQVNVRVPSGIVPGPAVPVRLNYLSRPSNEVSIGVR